MLTKILNSQVPARVERVLTDTKTSIMNNEPIQ